MSSTAWTALVERFGLPQALSEAQQASSYQHTRQRFEDAQGAYLKLLGYLLEQRGDTLVDLLTKLNRLDPGAVSAANEDLTLALGLAKQAQDDKTPIAARRSVYQQGRIALCKAQTSHLREISNHQKEYYAHAPQLFLPETAKQRAQQLLDMIDAQLAQIEQLDNLPDGTPSQAEQRLRDRETAAYLAQQAASELLSPDAPPFILKGVPLGAEATLSPEEQRSFAPVAADLPEAPNLRTPATPQLPEWPDSVILPSTRDMDPGQIMQYIRRNDLLMAAIATAFAVLTGLDLLWTNNPTFGSPTHYIQALAWGFGLHQVTTAIASGGQPRPQEGPR